MRFTKDRHQQGSLRKVQRVDGFVWEFRYRVAGKIKQVTVDGKEYKTEKAVRKHLFPLLRKINDGTAASSLQTITFNDVLTRFESEEMPPKVSTQGSYRSIIRTHLRPRWGSLELTEMKPEHIRVWLNSLDAANYTKGHIRSLMFKLFDLAMLWEYIPISRNPIELVKIKGITKREKAIQVLTIEQTQELIKKLPEPFNLMVMVVSMLGLRLSEMLALQWNDVDWNQKTVTIKRSSYRGHVDTAKTEASHAVLPLADSLAAVLLEWQGRADHESIWMFPNPATGAPYSGPSIQQRWLRPAGEEMGIKGLGFHALRHSYKSWLDAAGTPMGVMKDLMRHSAISVTMNVYGNTLSPEKRQYNQQIVSRLAARD